ncbi:MAG: hypothetical protein BGO90_06435 [Legionella sp. 40-6]|nr:MAG: hypothetical protein BGO90_06435 [Legionella sp. 40-6]
MLRFIAPLLVFVAPVFASGDCETKREIYIDNSSTKVWKTTLCPQQRLPFHTHDFARVLIPEEAGKLKVTYRSGKVRWVNLEAKKPIFLSKRQGAESHQDLNPGNQVLHLTLIELKG